jgi:hypothetical protein
MNNYVPPEMPNYPENLDDFLKILAPYFKEERPLDLFFELFIIDVTGNLPQKTKEIINQFSQKHPKFFEETKGNWLEFVKLKLNLSNTIEVAILDLWYRNSENAKKAGWVYHPWHYAMNFSENYLAEGSKIDIWEGNQLEMAKERIRQHSHS